jgi:hypothetical protein
MTSAGLVRASVLLTAQTCIAANLPGVEDSRLGGPCCRSGHTEGEEKLAYTRLVSNLGLLSVPRSHWQLLTPIAARCPSGCLVQWLSLHFIVLDWPYHGSSSPLWSRTTYTHPHSESSTLLGGCWVTSCSGHFALWASISRRDIMVAKRSILSRESNPVCGTRVQLEPETGTGRHSRIDGQPNQRNS